MAQINPALPLVGGDEDIWGTENNAVLTAVTAESNNQDLRITLLETTATSVQLRLTTVEGIVRDHTIAKPDGGAAGYVLTLNADGTSNWRPATGGVGDDGNDYVAIFQSALQGIDYTTTVTVSDNGDGTFAVSTTTTDNGDGTFTTTATTVDNGDGTFSFA